MDEHVDDSYQPKSDPEILDFRVLRFVKGEAIKTVPGSHKNYRTRFLWSFRVFHVSFEERRCLNAA